MLKKTTLTLGSLVAGSCCDLSEASSQPQPAKPKPPQPFKHRGYLGWITDLASASDPKVDWPSMRLDESLFRDYSQSFDLMRKVGFNEISIWGLYVARSWPVDIKSAVSPERGALVEKLIDGAHQRGIRVYSGLGVYSWGFEEIIKAHPKLTRGNPRAMCASEPESWNWMQRVIDFAFDRFAIDGVSMQSADQGRCECDQCRLYSQAEYHALLNVRASEYIRSRWPRKTIGVNSWGMKFEEPETLPALLKMSRKIDYLIDVHDTSRKRDPKYRKKIIDSLSCDFGTLGGPQVEPPQHWDRERWFLPTLKRVGEHLHQLGLEGGKACEYFFHILANPGDEISLFLAGRMLSDPARSWSEHLRDVVAELYQVSGGSVLDALCQLFLEAEEAYFKHLSAGVCGTISMEPLVSDRPGPPIYLSQRLNREQRTLYRAEILRLKEQAVKLIPEVPRKAKMERIVRCMENVLKDLESSDSA